MKYFFILGKNHELSLAELVQVLGSGFEVLGYTAPALIIESSKSIDLQAIQRRLGGTVKCGEISGEINSIKELPEFILHSPEIKNVKSKNKKFHFGFSVYFSHQLINSLTNKLHPLGIEIKRRLKEEGISSRLVASKEPALSSVIVTKEKLLDGWDIVLMPASKVKGQRSHVAIGRTLAVQDFKSYGERDYGRPGADALSGMLPPKLAKIMINLAQVQDGDTILDPFCGSGTVLQEALLLGYRRIVGSDMEKKAVEDTKINLEWLKEKAGADISGVTVIQCPAEELSRYVRGTEFGAIITEPYLGPALRGRETKQELVKTKRGLEQLYLAAFMQFVKILKPGGRVVMVLPIFVSKGEMMSMDIINDVKKMGFSVINPISSLSLSLPHSLFRWPLMYYREGQRVYREIWVFEKKQ